MNDWVPALVQINVYCGTPAGRQAFLAAHEALKSPTNFFERLSETELLLAESDCGVPNPVGAPGGLLRARQAATPAPRHQKA